jgi:hypothetical protein
MWKRRVEHVRDVVPDLVDLLRSAPPDPKLIRIEAIDGAGKSTLAKLLSAELHAVLVQSDEFVTPFEERRAYREHVRLPDFQRTLRGALNQGWAIADGVCLEEIAPEEEFGRGFRIYVKRLSFNLPDQPWWHGFDEDGAIPTREVDRSIHLYHFKHRPHEAADALIEIPELGHTLFGPERI